jgi:hypothetical protein
MVRRSIRRILLGLALLCVFPVVAQAQECNYCNQDLEGKNPLKCANCIKLSTQITKNNKRVWLIDFKQARIERAQIKDDTGDTEVFWFLPYTLTNKDDVPHDFFIDIKAHSDRGKNRHTYHDQWVPDAYEEIRKMLGKREDDQLLSQRDVSMPPPGEENELPAVGDKQTKRTAKIALMTIQPGETLDCVAIFKALDPELDRLTVTVRGLTNSCILVESKGQDYVAPKAAPNRRVITEAVLELYYKRPGDEFAHDTDPLVYVGRKWTDVKRTLKSDLKYRPSVLPGRR